jgi:hypothetical protein
VCVLIFGAHLKFLKEDLFAPLGRICVALNYPPHSVPQKS